jgi:polyhydroxyalkanoate synthesis regulator phasin
MRQVYLKGFGLVTVTKENAQSLKEAHVKQGKAKSKSDDNLTAKQNKKSNTDADGKSQPSAPDKLVDGAAKGTVAESGAGSNSAD